MDLKIRKASSGDFRVVSALAAATFYEAYVEYDDPEDLAGYVIDTFSPLLIKSELAETGNTFFLAEIEGRPVGYAKLRSGDPPGVLGNENAVEIQRIYLFSKFGRRGIGRSLIETCCEEASASGYSSVWLGVWSENGQAKEFYRRMGFEFAGQIDFVYGSGTFRNDLMLKRF